MFVLNVLLSTRKLNHSPLQAVTPGYRLGVHELFSS